MDIRWVNLPSKLQNIETEQSNKRSPIPMIKPGRNIALKVPPSEFERTIAFYRDVLGLRELGTSKDGAVGFDFEGKDIWLDRVPSISQAEVWLELRTDNLNAAAEYFSTQDIVRCDEIEELPDGFRGFWIKNPASLVHLVSEENNIG